MTLGEDQATQGEGLVVSLKAPSITRRLCCWVYEGVLLFGVVFIAGYLFSTLTQTRHGLQHRLWHQLFLFGVLGYYFTWFWHKGQTLAMKTWHIRVLNDQGQALTPMHALRRYLWCWIWFAPPLLFSYALNFSTTTSMALLPLWVLAWAMAARRQNEQQYWHDVWAKTRLVDVRPTLAKSPT